MLLRFIRGIDLYVVRSYSSEMLPCGKKGENLAKILTTQNILAFCDFLLSYIAYMDPLNGRMTFMQYE